MRFLADECLDGRIILGLRHAGHDVSALVDASRGAGDIAVVETALRERRVLITEDKDFGDLAVRRGLLTAGIILVRSAEADKAGVIRRLLALIERHGERLHSGYAVVSLQRTRFRSLPERP